MDKYFKECYVEKIYHFDGLKKINDMKEYSTMLYLVVNDDEPQNEQEESIKERMYERIAYFENNFKTYSQQKKAPLKRCFFADERLFF